LSETLKSVLSGKQLPTEIIIIDQSDSPNPDIGQQTFQNGCEIRYVSSNSRGLGKARNEGVRTARHDILIFLDDDMYICTEWFGNLVSALMNVRDGVVTGQVQAAEPESLSSSFAPSLTTESVARVYQGRLWTDVLFAGNMAAWRSVLTKTGPFDEHFGAGARFRSAEDNDFGFRLLESGYRIHYVPEAIVYHRCWRPQSAYRSVRWSYGFGQGAFYAKHARLNDRHMLWRMSKDVIRRTVRLPWLLIRNMHLAGGEAVFVAGLLSGAVCWQLTRPER